MTRLLYFLILFCALIPANGEGQGFLHARDTAIVDGSGKPVLLRGMGLGGWMLQEPYMLQLSGIESNQSDIRAKMQALIGKENTEEFYTKWLANFCTRADIDSLASWGFNSVRLPMHCNLFTVPVEEEETPGQNTWLEKGFQLTDSLLRWCEANRIYLILDLHAAPGGQGHDVPISDYDTTKASLWQSEANRQKTIALWEKLAERYANEQWIGGYDLLNETNWGFQDADDKNGCAEKENAPLRKLLMDITTAIRRVDKNHLIIVEGNCWGNNYSGVFPLWDANMAISFHKYWNNTDKASIQNFLDIRRQQNAPIWMGESGENSNVWFRNNIALLEQNNIGWCWWPLKKMGVNNPLQIATNEGYEAIKKYWKGEGEMPGETDAKQALMQLAEASRIDKNLFHPDVIDAMFRQVHSTKAIPFTQRMISGNSIIPAVDFDLGRNGFTYFAIDSANLWVSTGERTSWNKGGTYRNDAVDILVDEQKNNYVAGIKAGEWLQYTRNLSAPGKYNVKLRMKNATSTTRVSILVNNKDRLQSVAINAATSWHELLLGTVTLPAGENVFRLQVPEGVCDIESLILEKTK
ncbi:MAG: cellulase family glycosylhydrolase [Flavisolibacter sp.]